MQAIKSDDTQAAVAAVPAILERLSAVPSHRLVFYRILTWCESAKLYSALEESIRALPEMASSIYAPAGLVALLEETGALERLSVEENKKEEARWQTTAAGRAVVEAEAPAKRLLELIASQPVYREFYIQILRFCETPRSRDEIDSLLEGNPALEKPKVYPSFFVHGLEETGALQWTGKWNTTEIGKGVTA